MTLAYVLCVVKSGHEDETMDILSKYGEVSDCHMVYGEYDVIIKVVVDSPDDLREFLTNKVRSIRSIDRTTTLIAI